VSVLESSRRGKDDATTRPCPGCGSSTARILGGKNGFELMSCVVCRTVFTALIPGPTDAEDYDSYYTAENLEVPGFVERRLDEIVRAFDRYRVVNRLLDVGFGAGAAMKAAQRAGWSVEGVDTSSTAVAHASTQDMKAFCGELAEAEYPTGHFDVVVAAEVLEHVPRPIGLLSEIARILRPQGLLWATTPHARGVSMRVLGTRWSIVSPPEHLQLFSGAGIRALLDRSGLRPVRLETRGLNPLEIIAGSRIGGRSECDRVRSSYALNEALTATTLRRTVKRLANGVLRAARVGDSLAVHAERSPRD